MISAGPSHVLNINCTSVTACPRHWKPTGWDTAQRGHEGAVGSQTLRCSRLQYPGSILAPSRRETCPGETERKTSGSRSLQAMSSWLGKSIGVHISPTCAPRCAFPVGTHAHRAPHATRRGTTSTFHTEFLGARRPSAAATLTAAGGGDTGHGAAAGRKPRLPEAAAPRQRAEPSAAAGREAPPRRSRSHGKHEGKMAGGGTHAGAAGGEAGERPPPVQVPRAGGGGAELSAGTVARGCLTSGRSRAGKRPFATGRRRLHAAACHLSRRGGGCGRRGGTARPAPPRPAPLRTALSPSASSRGQCGAGEPSALPGWS